MRPLLILAALTLTACATFTPYDMRPSVQPIYNAVGSCTAWASGPSKWITAAHCTSYGRLTFATQEADLLYVDTVADLAILSGPKARPFRVASEPPRPGDALHIFGYAIGRNVLVLMPGIYVDTKPFFSEDTEFLLAMANGMPGMSGGPIFKGQRVVSVITGGGTATSPTQLIGTGVPFDAFRAFLSKSNATGY